MDPHADRLARGEPYVNDELPRFVSLADLEPVEVTLAPAANPYGGGSAVPADMPPTAGYFGGSFSDVAPAPTQYRGGAALVTDVEPPQPSRSRFVCDGRSAPIGQAGWLLSGLRRERRVPVGIARRPRRRGAGRPGHRRVRSTRAGPDDPPGEPSRRRAGR